MKILTIIVPLLFGWAVQAQTETPVFKIRANGVIETNQSMIEPFFDMPETPPAPYILNSSVSVSVGTQNYDIKTGYFKEMDETESGKNGFTVITIYLGNRKIFELRQPAMWTHTYDGRTMMDYRRYTDNCYFIPVPLSEQAVALAFVGWPYGGDVPYLTIVVLTENDAKLVFNKHMDIDTITRTDKSYLMKLGANIVEYDENARPFNEAIFNYLEAKNGLLYFK